MCQCSLFTEPCLCQAFWWNGEGLFSQGREPNYPCLQLALTTDSSSVIFQDIERLGKTFKALSAFHREGGEDREGQQKALLPRSPVGARLDHSAAAESAKRVGPRSRGWGVGRVGRAQSPAGEIHPEPICGQSRGREEVPDAHLPYPGKVWAHAEGVPREVGAAPRSAASRKVPSCDPQEDGPGVGPRGEAARGTEKGGSLRPGGRTRA